MKNNKLINYLPIYLVLGYSLFTIILFAACPWDWNIENPFKLYSYLIILNTALGLGYWISIKKYKSSNVDYANYNQIIIKTLTMLLYVYLTIQILAVFTDYDVSITNLLTTLWDAIRNPAKYYYAYEQSTTLYAKLIIWTNMLFAPIFYCIVPLCTYYFKSLKLNAKIAFGLLVFFELSKGILKGTNKGIFDLIFIIVVVIFINKLRKYKTLGLKSFILNNIIPIVGIVLLLGIVLVYFSNNISSRISYSLEVSLGGLMGGIKLKENSFLQMILPSGILNMILIISTYLCQGYYGLNLALSVPFSSTYGVGFSNFLMANTKEMLDIDLYSKTYLAKVNDLGWSSTVNWHTMYTWFANDVSFIGVIFIMFLIGFIFAKVWVSFIENNDPIALVILTLFATMFLYMSANNQVFNFPSTCVAFFGLMTLWCVMKLIEKKKINIPSCIIKKLKALK